MTEKTQIETAAEWAAWLENVRAVAEAKAYRPHILGGPMRETDCMREVHRPVSGRVGQCAMGRHVMIGPLAFCSRHGLEIIKIAGPGPGGVKNAP